MPSDILRLSKTVAVLGLATTCLGLTGCAGYHKNKPKADLAASNITTIGVNAYLWRATLDTVGFMPMLQTDSSGGVIVTDWYINPNSPGERMKLTISILDKDLRADALQVGASRQVLQGGQWIDQPVQAATTQKIEEIILTRARDLRSRQAVG